ncbi:unnamed protein product, partial [marine sediment metagenome]
MHVPAAKAGGRPTNNRRIGIITIPPPIPSKPPRTPAKNPLTIKII